MTAKEVAQMPDPPNGSRDELVRGVVVPSPPSNFAQGVCQGNVGFILSTYAKATRTGRATLSMGVVTETDPDTVRWADATFWSAERLPFDETPEGYLKIAPDLCVNVLSPRDKGRNLRVRIREYLACGIRMVWIVDHEKRTVTVYRRPGDGRVLWDDATLTGEDVLPGFSCPVAEFFAP